MIVCFGGLQSLLCVPLLARHNPDAETLGVILIIKADKEAQPGAATHEATTLSTRFLI